jgi:tetratricopeptide (TPR) repeat protein
MRPMPSRLLNQLEAAIAAAPTRLIADCSRAERACYMARQGRLDEARSTVTALRQQYGTAPNVAMSAWLSLAEGLESYFRNLGEGSRDKVMRAHAFSAAAGLVTMQALSAAWLAQMDFTKLDAEPLARHAKQALKLAAPNDHSARSRVSLVLAQSLHVAGRLDLALPWYRRAHAHATTQGDDATISALMHNMACMRLDNLRQAKLTGLGDGSDGDLVLTGTESTGRFDQLVGASSLNALKPLLRARTLSLLGRPSEALILYEEHLSIDVDQGFTRMKSDLLSDVAWCRLQLDQRESALASAISAEANLNSETQIDDVAATHTRLGWVYLAIGDDEVAQRHRVLASLAWNSYVELQARIVELLIGLSENG